MTAKSWWIVIIAVIIIAAIINAVSPSEDDPPSTPGRSYSVDAETREGCSDSWYTLPKGPGDRVGERAGFTQSEFVTYCVAYEKELQK